MVLPPATARLSCLMHSTHLTDTSSLDCRRQILSGVEACGALVIVHCTKLTEIWDINLNAAGL